MLLQVERRQAKRGSFGIHESRQERHGHERHNAIEDIQFNKCIKLLQAREDSALNPSKRPGNAWGMTLSRNSRITVRI